MRLHRLYAHRVRLVPRRGEGRLRRPRPRPACSCIHGPTGRGQDHRPRRRLLRPLRPGARRAQQRQAPALRPRPAPAPAPERRRWSVTRPRPAGSGSPAPRPGSGPSCAAPAPTEEKAKVLAPGAGAGGDWDGAHHPRSTRPATWSSGLLGHERRAVLPGRDAAAGRVREVPARRRRGAPQAAGAPVRRQDLHPGGVLARRPPHSRPGASSRSCASRWTTRSSAWRRQPATTSSSPGPCPMVTRRRPATGAVLRLATPGEGADAIGPEVRAGSRLRHGRGRGRFRALRLAARPPDLSRCGRCP